MVFFNEIPSTISTHLSEISCFFVRITNGIQSNNLDETISFSLNNSAL